MTLSPSSFDKSSMKVNAQPTTNVKMRIKSKARKNVDRLGKWMIGHSSPLASLKADCFNMLSEKAVQSRGGAQPLQRLGIAQLQNT
mmetsp:Transcript_5713/g.10176  ORF Transcript_5713/g.10176 Transcript_5713/m.10176 type:complete len:86 (-) Transcript_5713:7-264(-)